MAKGLSLWVRESNFYRKMKELLIFLILCLSPVCLKAGDFRNDLLLKGDICVQQGDIEQSIFYYTQAIIENPNNVKAYLKRADAYLFLRRLHLAEEDYNQAISIDPMVVKTYLEEKKSGLLQYNNRP